MIESYYELTCHLLLGQKFRHLGAGSDSSLPPRVDSDDDVVVRVSPVSELNKCSRMWIKNKGKEN